MSALLIFFAIALLLLWALFAFLEKDHSVSSSVSDSFSLPSGQAGSCDSQEFAALGHALFSDQDWAFVQSEQSPSLNKLFIEERRALIAHWLRESSARLHAIRMDHVQNSRHAENLDVVAEAKLLLLFSYLGLLCWSLLLIVRFSHPAAPSVLATHFQSVSSRLFASSSRRVLAPAASDRHTSMT